MELKWMSESEYTRAVKKEKKFAKKYGGKVQPCSGRLPIAKGDIKLDDFLLEYKHTQGKQYTLRFDILEKIQSEAISIGKNSGLVVDFSEYGEKYIIIKEEIFQALLD